MFAIHFRCFYVFLILNVEAEVVLHSFHCNESKWELEWKWFLHFQIMYHAACTFILIIFTLYSIFRYIFQPNEFFKQQTLLHIEWQITFLCVLIVIIYHASRLTREVWMSRRKKVYKFSNKTWVKVYLICSRNRLGKTNGPNCS